MEPSQKSVLSVFVGLASFDNNSTGVFSSLKFPLQVVVCRSSAARILDHVLVRYGRYRHG